MQQDIEHMLLLLKLTMLKKVILLFQRAVQARPWVSLQNL